MGWNLRQLNAWESFALSISIVSLRHPQLKLDGLVVSFGSKLTRTDLEDPGCWCRRVPWGEEPSVGTFFSILFVWDEKYDILSETKDMMFHKKASSDYLTKTKEPSVNGTHDIILTRTSPDRCWRWVTNQKVDWARKVVGFNTWLEPQPLLLVEVLVSGRSGHSTVLLAASVAV